MLWICAFNFEISCATNYWILVVSYVHISIKLKLIHQHAIHDTDDINDPPIKIYISINLDINTHLYTYRKKRVCLHILYFKRCMEWNRHCRFSTRQIEEREEKTRVSIIYSFLLLICLFQVLNNKATYEKYWSTRNT